MATVKWTMRAAKQLAKLPKHDQTAVRDGVDTLAQWPECRHVKALTNRGDYRLRVGRYRVIFTVDAAQGAIVVRIEEVKQRNERTYQ
jgi:mRNA interferase RelE/StbE